MALPTWTNLNRRTERAPVNPLDKATVVSIYPKDVKEYKPTIFPGTFFIPKGKIDNPSVLVVGSSSWWREIDEDMPLLEIPNSSVAVAESIVRDYCNGILGSDMAGAMPGLFYVAGEHTATAIKTNFQEALKAADAKQKNWYKILCNMADSLWARSNGNPMAISDDMRMAASELGIANLKDWMKAHQMVEMVRCKACGSLRNPAYPVCPTCKVVDDPDKAKEMKLQFAS